MLVGLDLCIYIFMPGSFMNGQIITLCSALEKKSLRYHFKNIIYVLESVSA